MSIHEREWCPIKPAKVFVVLREGVIVCFEVPKAEGSSQVLVHMIQGWLVLQIFLWAQERPREVGTGMIWTKPCMQCNNTHIQLVWEVAEVMVLK